MGFKNIKDIINKRRICLNLSRRSFNLDFMRSLRNSCIHWITAYTPRSFYSLDNICIKYLIKDLSALQVNIKFVGEIVLLSLTFFYCAIHVFMETVSIIFWGKTLCKGILKQHYPIIFGGWGAQGVLTFLKG